MLHLIIQSPHNMTRSAARITIYVMCNVTGLYLFNIYQCNWVIVASLIDLMAVL